MLNKGEGVAAGQEGKMIWVWTGQEVFEKQAIQVCTALSLLNRD